MSSIIAAMTQDGTALREWVQTALGGPAERWSRLVSGNSRTTWAADIALDGATRPVIVRADSGDGPYSDTPLSLEREAVVYRALQDSGIPIPRLYGYDAAVGAIALERAPGVPAWDGDVLDALLGELARLHTIDPASLALPGFSPSALGDVELWSTIAQRRVSVDSPFAAFAFERLREHFPGEPERLVLDHGDPGVGNLLWEDGRITALLDWELSHLGDPHDDLAFLTVRAALFGVPLEAFGSRVRKHYAPAAGVRLDTRRLEYWQAVGLLRNLITCLASISNPVRGRDRLVHHMLIPSLNRLIVDALARLEGVELAPPVPVATPPAQSGSEVVAEIAGDLAELAAATSDPDQRQRVKRMRYLLAQLAETWPLSARIADADAAEGPPATDPAERLAQLAERADRLLGLFPRARTLATAQLAGFD
jgi:aminoglycoside phosphotransferase (APT) family kinase protein